MSYTEILADRFVKGEITFQYGVEFMTRHHVELPKARLLLEAAIRRIEGC